MQHFYHHGDTICHPNSSYLKLKCMQYPAIDTNYSCSNCSISNLKDLNRSSEFLVINFKNKLNFRLNSQCKRRLTWSPKRMDSTNQTRLPAVARAHCDIFSGWPAMARDGEVLQLRQHFCHPGDTICHPKSGYVTTELHRTSTCGCNNNVMFSGRAIFAFPTVVVCWPCQSRRGKPWRFMPNCKYGSPVEIIIFLVQYFFSA